MLWLDSINVNFWLSFSSAHWLYFAWTSFILLSPFFDIQIKLILGNSLHHKDGSVCVPAHSPPDPTASRNQHVADFILVMISSLSSRGLPNQMCIWERISVLAKSLVPDTEREFSSWSLAKMHCRLVMTVEVFILWWPLAASCMLNESSPSSSFW